MKQITVNENGDMVEYNPTKIPDTGYWPEHDAFHIMTETARTMQEAVHRKTNNEHEHEEHDQLLGNGLKESKLFHELNQMTVNSHFAKNKPFFIILTCDCKDDMVEWTIEDLEATIEAQELQKHFTLLYAKPDTTKNFRFVNTFGISHLPAIVIDNIPIGPTNEKYVFENGGKHIEGIHHDTTMKDIIQFMENFVAGTAKMKIRSEKPHPPPKKEEAMHVVGSNFEQLLLNNEKDVIVLIYSPACGACQAVLPIMDDVAKILQNQENVIVATFDRTLNDIPLKGVQIRQYPTLLLFQGKNKKQPLNFMNYQMRERLYFEAEGIIKFLENHGSNKIDSKKIIRLLDPEKSLFIKTLTPGNFESIIKDTKKDVILTIGASWCPYSRRLMPVYERVAQQLTSDKNIVVAMIDGSKHRSITQKYAQAYPTILMFPADNKQNPTKFSGFRTIPGLLNFIRDNRYTDSNLASQRFFHVHYEGDALRWYKHHRDEYFERQDKNEEDKIVWMEYTNGKVTHSFIQETGDDKSQQYIVYDKSRGMHIRITPQNIAWSNNGKQFTVFERGQFYGKQVKR